MLSPDLGPPGTEVVAGGRFKRDALTIPLIGREVPTSEVSVDQGFQSAIVGLIVCG
jgi:hypothetical protein